MVWKFWKIVGPQKHLESAPPLNFVFLALKNSLCLQKNLFFNTFWLKCRSLAALSFNNGLKILKNVWPSKTPRKRSPTLNFVFLTLKNSLCLQKNLFFNNFWLKCRSLAALSFKNGLKFLKFFLALKNPRKRPFCIFGPQKYCA